MGGESVRSQGPLPATPNLLPGYCARKGRHHGLTTATAYLDDTDTLSVTAAMLDRLGYSVRAETEGLNALQTFSEAPDRFDLALIDHGMADLTGLELAQRFRRMRPDFPVVMYTGYLDTPSAQQIEAAGIGGRLIIKPATMKELADALQQALHESARSKTEL